MASRNTSRRLSHILARLAVAIVVRSAICLCILAFAFSQLTNETVFKTSLTVLSHDLVMRLESRGWAISYTRLPANAPTQFDSQSSPVAEDAFLHLLLDEGKQAEARRSLHHVAVTQPLSGLRIFDCPGPLAISPPMLTVTATHWFLIAAISSVFTGHFVTALAVNRFKRHCAKWHNNRMHRNAVGRRDFESSHTSASGDAGRYVAK